MFAFFVIIRKHLEIAMLTKKNLAKEVQTTSRVMLDKYFMIMVTFEPAMFLIEVKAKSSAGIDKQSSKTRQGHHFPF